MIENSQDWERFRDLLSLNDKAMTGWAREETYAAYIFKLLRHYELSDVVAAINSYALTGKGLIAPSDIVNFIEGSVRFRALRAWRIVRKAFVHPGGAMSVRFPGAAYHYAICEYMSWPRFCMELNQSDASGEAFLARDWQTFYERGLVIASWDQESGKERVAPYLKGEEEFDKGSGNARLPPVQILGLDGRVAYTLPQTNFEASLRAAQSRQTALGGR